MSCHPIRPTRPLRLLAAALLGALSLSTPGLAQDFPTKPIRIIVPYPPGGGVEVVARILSAGLTPRLKQPVIVESRAGAFGNIGVEYVAKAAPDGYTVLLNTVAQAITPSTFNKLPFDPVADFAPITQVSRTTLVLAASPKFEARDIKELVAAAKAQPGKLNYASSGLTNPLHLAMELLKLQTGTDIMPIIYKGDGPMLTAIMSDEVQMGVVSLASASNALKSGRLRALGVTTQRRSDVLPDVPAIGEAIPGYQLVSWQALFAPAKTPREIVSRLQRETAAVLKEPEVREKFQGFGAEPVGNTPEEFAAIFKADVATFGKIVKAAKIPPQD
jgi:tripartite-type tricarboxylate transporter receptor subunit TctC